MSSDLSERKSHERYRLAWIDEVATKGDLAELPAELRNDMASLETRLIRTVTNWMMTILVAAIGAIASVALIT